MDANLKKALDAKTRGYTKAQIWEELRNMQVEKMAMEHERNEARHANAQLVKDLQETGARNDGMRARIDSLLEGQAERDDKIHWLDQELRQMTTARDHWKDEFLKEQAANRKSKELLVRQAHLAGELAQMVTPANLRNN